MLKEHVVIKFKVAGVFKSGERGLNGAEEEPYQDEVGLIGGEHEDGDVLLRQRSDDRLGDLCHPHGLRAAGRVAVGDHIQRQPDGSFHLEMLRGLEL